MCNSYIIIILLYIYIYEVLYIYIKKNELEKIEFENLKKNFLYHHTNLLKMFYIILNVN